MLKGVIVILLRCCDIFDLQLHSDIIRDVTFLGDSWPWCSGETTFVTASVDGHGKVGWTVAYPQIVVRLV